MDKAKDTENMGTMADYLVRKLKDETNGLENAIAFLKAAFLSSAVDALFHARREAGLTQEQVAQKLGKKQEAIARWEADTEGKMSLGQYFDIAVACGKVPLNMVLESVETVHDFVIDYPEEPQTPYLYSAWLKRRSEPTPVSQPPVHTFTVQAIGALAPPTNMSISTQENTLTVKSVEQYLKQTSPALAQGPNENATNTPSATHLPFLGQSVA